MKNCAVMFLSILLFGCVETIDITYKNYDDAKKKGAIKSGWVPKWFPQIAFDINESHNIDTNQIIIGWKNSGKWNIPDACKQISPHDAPAPGIKRSWWPADVPASEFSTYRHIFYRCDKDEYLAVDPDSSEGYYWKVNR